MRGPTASMWIETSATAVVAMVGCGILLGLLLARPALRETTLVAPWLWSVISVLAIVGCEVALALISSGSFSPARLAALRYLAHVTLFCPLMAVLGAKRPQNREWSFIVVSWWVVLALPAISTLLFPSGDFQIGWPWWLLLTGASVMTMVNYGPTKFWLSGLSLTVAQLTVVPGMVEFGDGVGAWSAPAAIHSLAALVAVAAALAAAYLSVRFWPRTERAAIDRVWLDFRDAYGSIWALRVADRVNAAAAASAWGVALGWRGFRSTSKDGTNGLEIPPAVAPVLEQTVRNLLRRFVDNSWLDARLSSGSEHPHFRNDA